MSGYVTFFDVGMFVCVCENGATARLLKSIKLELCECFEFSLQFEVTVMSLNGKKYLTLYYGYFNFDCI